MEQLRFKFAGGRTDLHQIDAKELGKSLIGLDKAANEALIILTTGRKPIGRQRFDFVVTAEAPKAGSVELITAFGALPWILPIFQDVVKQYGAEFLKTFLDTLLLWHGGRKAEAAIKASDMIEMAKEIHRHTEVMSKDKDALILEVIAALKPTAQQIVEPVGRSASILSITSDKGADPVIVDSAMADVIRSKDELTLDDAADHIISIDGIIAKTHYMKIHIDGHESIKPRTADVKDPIFDLVPNPYRDAFAADHRIKVRGRLAWKGDEVAKLFITEFVELVT